MQRRRYLWRQGIREMGRHGILLPFLFFALFAGAIIGSVPIVIVYVFFLDYYVSSLTAGSVKG